MRLKQFGWCSFVSALTLFSACSSIPDSELNFSRAVESNDLELVAVLLDGGADPNGDYVYQASLGSGFNDRNIALVGLTLLDFAVARRSERVAQLLLTRGADPNHVNELGETTLAYLSPVEALAQGTVSGSLVSSIIAGASRQFVCARELSPATVGQMLLRIRSIDVLDRAKLSPAMRAAACGHAETLRLLLSAGATLELASPTGETALFFAAGSGRPRTVQLLIEAGASVDARNHALQTPLMAASAFDDADHVASAGVLVNGKATLDAQDGAGDTALIIAARASNTSVVELLLRAGANPRIENRKKETAFSVSRGATLQLLRGD